MTLKPHSQTDHYEVESILGKGGMGIVYLAYDRRLDRKVAIKCIRQNRASNLWVTAVREEAKLLAQINHTNIVQIYDLIEWQGAPALVMEYVQGRTLLDWLCSEELLGDALDLATRLDWLRQIAQGLRCAHDKGIIHRDLKPENIMIAADGQVKIMDFGIARHQAQPQAANIHDSQALPGEYIGSPASLSPEQAMGDDLTTASDIFSFGILAYSLLCKHHPFGDTQNPDGILQGILYRAPLPVTIAHTSAGQLEWLAPLLLNSLDKDPRARPTAATLAQKLVLQKKPEATQVAAAASPRTGRSLWVYATSALLILLAVASLWLLMPKSQPLQHVLVLSPTQHISGVHNTHAASMLLSAVDNTIQEALLSLPYIRLIDRHELDALDTQSVQAIALQTGATAVVRPAINCQADRCAINLDLLKGEEWRVAAKETWPIYSDSSLDIYYTTWQKTLLLFGADVGKPSQITEQQYLQYITTLRQYKQNSTIEESDFDQLSNTLKSSPGFLPGYRLLTLSAISNYHATNDSKLLAQIQNMLTFQAAKIEEPQLIQLQSLILMALKQLPEAEHKILQLRELGQLDSHYELMAKLALERNDFATAEQLFLKMAKSRKSVNVLYSLAYCQYAQGMLNRAKATLTSILKMSSHHTPSVNFLAAISVAQGDLGNATTAYQKLADNSQQPADHNNLAVIYLLSGDLERATAAAQEALKLAPKKPDYLLTLGEIHLAGDDRLSAEENFVKAITYSKRNSDIDSLVVIAMANIHLNKLAEASAVLQMAKAEGGDNLDVRYAEILYLNKSGDTVAAVKGIEDIVAKGYDLIWFQLPWFKNLCDQPSYHNLLRDAALTNYCTPNSSGATAAE